MLVIWDRAKASPCFHLLRYFYYLNTFRVVTVNLKPTLKGQVTHSDLISHQSVRSVGEGLIAVDSSHTVTLTVLYFLDFHSRSLAAEAQTSLMVSLMPREELLLLLLS